MARFTASIDDNLKAQLDSYAEEHGYNRSEALEIMIRRFFEDGASAPETPVPQPPEEAASLSESARLDQLEKQVAKLQRRPRVGSPMNVRMEQVEMEARLARMEAFLQQQHGYIEGLHEIVSANANACLGGFTELETEVELFVPSEEPPTPNWAEPL